MTTITIPPYSFARAVVLIVPLLFIVGLLLVSYTATAALVVGVFIVGVTRLLAQLNRRLRSVILLLLAFLGLCVLPVLLLLGPSTASLFYRINLDTSGAAPDFHTYQIVIQPLDPALHAFSVDEEIELTFQGQRQRVRLPPRQVAGTSRGLLVKELAFQPLNSSLPGWMNWTAPDGTQRTDSPCGIADCLPAHLQLKDWAAGSFYVSPNVRELKLVSGPNTESFNGSVPKIRETFSWALSI